MSKQKAYHTFRQMFPEFIYDSYQYNVQPDGLHIVFLFQLKGLRDNNIFFRPTALIPARPFLDFCQPREIMDNLVFHIGMIELISYWKSVCPPSVVVRCGQLSESQISFWKKLYFNGLGEFFYTNGIHASQDDFLHISSSGPQHVPCPCPLSDDYLVPVGGGKDSAVTLELLRREPSLARPIPLIMNPRGATVGTIEAAGYSLDDVAVIRRTIDPKLLELNANGCLNGHTPFSAMLGFYTLLVSQLSGRRNIALSNECSASESTVIGTNINHQYSKSLEFEQDFRSYVARYLSPDYNYFSFLRPVYELEIANLFAHYCQAYFPVFRSCNVGSKKDIWCGHCAKCLFVYIMLAPLLEKDESLVQIFGHDLLDDTSLQLEFDQLTGKAETKPFECVGTVEEANAALSMLIERRGWNDDSQRPALLRGYSPHPYDPKLFLCHPQHHLSEAQLAILSHAVEAVVPFRQDACLQQLKSLFEGKEILIAGYGREGKSSATLLRRVLPQQSFDIAQNNEEIARACASKKYDLILKSPGIPTSFFDTLCAPEALSSQTDIFLQLFGSQTIGVTGTKGKSTTTHLIAHLLQDSGHEVLMAGNMGIPLFDIVPSVGAQSMVVCEFSCHQLENIHRAPHIAVLLNLFQEHLDHYRDYHDYQMAKMQIALRQQAGDLFFYCQDNEDIRARMEELKDLFPGTLCPYSLEMARNGSWAQSPSSLQGDHNRCNIHVACEIARHTGGTKAAIESSLSSFHGLEHRLELVGTFHGVTYYNDSISTIPEACMEAVKALQKVETLILGGFDRGIDYSGLVEFLVQEKTIRNLVFVGQAGARMAQLLEGRLPECNVLMENDYNKIVPWCGAHTGQGMICLLSPAAASYDSFRNFEERGRLFKQLVCSL